MRRHLVLFARRPHLGVKSRLAAGVGALNALRFYRDTSTRLLRRLRRPGWTCWLALPPGRGGTPPGWGRGWRRRDQGRGGLDRRMERVLLDLPPGPVVIVGSDLPGLTAGHVAAAFAALGRVEAVLGPAADGGYWLIGLRRRRRPWRPFAGVRLSTADALADTLAALPPRQSRRLLAVLDDVDDAAALDRAHAKGLAAKAWRAAHGGAGAEPSA